MVSTLADNYLHASSHSAGGAAKITSVRKESIYSLQITSIWINCIQDPWNIQFAWFQVFVQGRPTFTAVSDNPCKTCE